MPLTSIASDSLLPVEQHFRIAAGPGAGKTHWLVSHIKNVLQHSKKLGRTKKIACITYTNVAVDTILRRLDFVADRVEVSTIHSFIYKNIVKPYVSFIAGDFELNVLKMDGHEDLIVSRKKITEWLNGYPGAVSLSHPYTLRQLIQRPENMEALVNWLSSISYEFTGDQLEIKTYNSQAYYIDGTDKRKMLSKANCLDKLIPALPDFKKIYWRKGILHHDDVLYFGYLLLRKYPFIVSVLQGKFPYFFMDEFQDTSPIQNAIVNILGQKEIKVGIIGDKAQSIYSFQGASPVYFDSFSLPGFADYVIADNRRSTQMIVNLLNHIRKDIQQNPIRNIAGTKPILIVGAKIAAVAEVKKILGHSDFTMLSRDNITSNSLKREFNSAIPSVNLITTLSNTDSDSERRGATISCIKAVELAKQKRFKEAIKEMERNFFSVRDKSLRKKTSFRQLAFLLSKYDEYKKEKLLDFCSLIKAYLRPDLSKLTRGAAFDFCNNNSYEQLAVCVNIPDDNSPSRTIHKSKGDEFENLMVLIKDQTDLRFLLNSDLTSEEQRIWYVAVSRAMNHLFLSVPELNPATEAKLSSLLDIQRI